MSAPPLKDIQVRNCIQKFRCSDEFAARAAAQARLQKLGWKDGLGVYRCPICAGWHLTSKKSLPKYYRVTDTDVYPTLTKKES